MSSKKEVLVVGFGAVGVIYSYILKMSGKVNVTCVARGNYNATQAGGIHIKSRKYGNDIRGWKPDRLFRTVAEAADRSYSHVIVATKALPDVAPLPALLSPLFSGDSPNSLPTFVILQNGLSVEKDLYETIKRLGKDSDPCIISTALWIGTNLLENNIVDHSHSERLHIGMYRPRYQPDVSNTSEEAAILQEFADFLEPCGSVVYILDEIQRVKFRKNFWNAGIGSCCTLIRHAPMVFFNDPGTKAQMAVQIRAIMDEILAIGRAIGFDEQALPSDTVDDVLESTDREYNNPQNTHRPSMLVDLDVGRPMEIEVIVGELIRSAKEFNVPVPRLQLIYSLLKVLQHQIKG